MLTNLRDAFEGQSSTKLGTFYMLAVCYKSVRRTVFEIFDFKNAVTLKTELGVHHGHWKCHHSKERV